MGTRLLPILLLLAVLGGCRSGQAFESLQEPASGRALIYLIRPAVSPWSWRKFTVNVYRFRGHFTEDQDPPLVASIDMSNNEYRRLYLEEGYYRFELVGHSSRIIRARKDALEFYEVYLFSRGFLYFPDLDIRETTGKRALAEMAGRYPMFEYEKPIYCCSNGSESDP